jgi:hypothetical protein
MRREAVRKYFCCFDLGKLKVQADSTRVIETHRKQLVAPRLESWLGAIVEAPRSHDTITAAAPVGYRTSETSMSKIHRSRDPMVGAKLCDCPKILRRQARILRHSDICNTFDIPKRGASDNWILPAKKCCRVQTHLLPKLQPVDVIDLKSLFAPVVQLAKIDMCQGTA